MIFPFLNDTQESRPAHVPRLTRFAFPASGNAKNGLNPEPYAYESAFGVRHLIQQQMKGEPSLGEGKAPLLLWGPYLWAEGTRGRRLDELKWEPGDFNNDGTHPSESGRE